MGAATINIISKNLVYPVRPSKLSRVPLTVTDVRLLPYHYTQLSLLFHRPVLPSTDLLHHLRSALSRALSFYPPLAGRFSTDCDGCFFIDCNDAGVEFVHAEAPGLFLADVLVYDSDVPSVIYKDLVPLNGVASIEGFSVPLAAVQVTEMADGLSVGFSINHAVADGTSTMNFVSAWSEICRGVDKISRPPEFGRCEGLPKAPPLMPFTPDGSANSPAIRDRVFNFSREAMQEIKNMANSPAGSGGEISSFQSLCAFVWRSVTRARCLSHGTLTKLQLAADVRERMKPPLGPNYFGTAVMLITTSAEVEEVVERGVSWCAQLLHRNVVELGDEAVKKEVKTLMELKDPRTLARSDGPFVAFAASPRFQLYECDMGWGQPAGAISGTANKVDGLVLTVPARDGRGSIDLELCLAPETMAKLISDGEFMQYVSLPELKAKACAIAIEH